MQLLPAFSNGTTNATDLVGSTIDQLSASATGAGGEFGTVLSSFIEEGRTDYSGRPAGFSAYEAPTGTMGEAEAHLLKDSLRKRDVQEESMRVLDQLMASGTPVTVGKIFSTLSGTSRASAPLEGKERDDFKMLLSKMGLSKDEVDELLAMTDDGKKAAAWKRIAAKMESLGAEGLDASKSELAALCKGLELSDATKAQLDKLFAGGAETLRLTKIDMDALMAEITAGLAKEELAAQTVQKQMRAAMNDALQASKLQKISEPVADKRGTLRTDQSEELMQASVLKKAGQNNLMQADKDGKKDAEADAEAFADSKKGNSRAERILATGPDGKVKEAKTSDAPKDAISQLLHRVDVAGMTTQPQQNANTAQNLNSLANSFRQEIFSQVENGIMQNAQNGTSQLTMQLNPGNLGQLTVILNVSQGEVRATIKADNQDTTNVLREQMAELKATLEAQGLKVKELDVQTQLKDNSFAGQGDGTKEHNLMRDSQERDRMIRLSQMRRGAGMDAGQGEVLESRASSTGKTGLHIVA